MSSRALVVGFHRYNLALMISEKWLTMRNIKKATSLIAIIASDRLVYFVKSFSYTLQGKEDSVVSVTLRSCVEWSIVVK